MDILSNISYLVLIITKIKIMIDFTKKLMLWLSLPIMFVIVFFMYLYFEITGKEAPVYRKGVWYHDMLIPLSALTTLWLLYCLTKYLINIF